MRILTDNLAWKLAAMAVLGMSATVAQAGHYRDIDDHARDIERDAERAQRIVKYDFRRVPIDLRNCLLTNLYGLEENADCIRDLTRRSGNLDEIARHARVMSRQLAEVEGHVDELRTWCRSCVVPRHQLSSCGTMSRDHARSLRELCERTERICSELRCMTAEIESLKSAGFRHDRYRHVSAFPGGPTAFPAYGLSGRSRTGLHIGVSSFRRHDDRDDRDGRRGRRDHDDEDDHHHGRDGRFGRDFGSGGRGPVNVPLFRHNGRSFGFSLSIR